LLDPKRIEDVDDDLGEPRWSEVGVAPHRTLVRAVWERRRDATHLAFESWDDLAPMPQVRHERVDE
jgi:hypothetical protein